MLWQDGGILSESEGRLVERLPIHRSPESGLERIRVSLLL